MSLHADRREPTLDPPENLDLTDWCQHHGGSNPWVQPLVGFHRECLLCVARQEWTQHLLPCSLDDPHDFQDWAGEEFAGAEAVGIQLIRDNWALALRRFRWDTGVEGDRTTVLVTVCAWCSEFQSVVVLRLADALRDDPYLVSHGMCQGCLDKQAAMEVE